MSGPRDMGGASDVGGARDVGGVRDLGSGHREKNVTKFTRLGGVKCILKLTGGR